MVCGVDDWVAIEEFGLSQAKWFTGLLGLEHGIPSHDTFGEVYAAIDTDQFSDCFSRWVADLASITEGEVIAIDGKCLRRGLDKASKKAAIYMVSAWAQQNNLVLGQVKVDGKSNEITAIPKLLSRLDIAGAVVTVDAMGCQKKIAGQIKRQGGDYVFSLEGDQGNLRDDVKTFFASPLSPAVAAASHDGGHGRIETRALRAAADIAWLQGRHGWKGLQSIVAVTAKREIGDKVTEETRVLSAALMPMIRSDWGVWCGRTGRLKTIFTGFLTSPLMKAMSSLNMEFLSTFPVE